MIDEPELETTVPPPNPPTEVKTGTGDDHEGETQCSLCLIWIETKGNDIVAITKHRESGECNRMFATRGERKDDDRRKQRLLENDGDAEVED